MGDASIEIKKINVHKDKKINVLKKNIIGMTGNLNGDRQKHCKRYWKKKVNLVKS